jgi:hypothetical protein
MQVEHRSLIMPRGAFFVARAAPISFNTAPRELIDVVRARRSCMLRILLIMAALAIAGEAAAQNAAPISVSPPASSVNTSAGPALVTGSTGSAQIIMIPGSAVGGLLMNNGNGTSTVLSPGSVPQVVPTPR